MGTEMKRSDGQEPRRRRWVVLAVGVIATMLCAGVGVALATSSDAPITPKQYAQGARSSRAAQPGALDAATFGILRRPRTAADDIDPTQLAYLKSDPQSEGLTGANFAQARRVEGLKTGSAWVVPGNGWVCVYSSSTADGSLSVTGLGGGMCVPDTHAITGTEVGAGTRAARPGVEFITGLVPDGVNEVTLHWASGDTQTVPVAENIYNALVRQGVKSVSFTGPNGPVNASLNGGG